MKAHLFPSVVVAAALSVSAFGADDKTIGEKTSDTLKSAGEKTKEAGKAAVEGAKDAGHAVVEGSKKAGHAVAEGTKKAVDVVKDAVTPDADAKRVDVTLAEKRVEHPKQIDAGKTAFVVRNNGSMKRNFEIRGEGIDKKFLTDVDPNESKTLHVDLKPGTYTIHMPDAKGTESTLMVK